MNWPLLGVGAGVLLFIAIAAISAVLYFENHDYMNLDGIKKEEFCCYRGNLKIRGTLFLPAEQSKRPIAVVCHEFMVNRLFSYPYAMALAKIGYAAFCFDFCGGGLFCESNGSTRDMSVLTEKEDLSAVIAFARELSYTNDQPLLLMGCSQGGLVAALTAAEKPDEIGGLILQYPALLIPDAARTGKMLWMSFDPNNIPKEMRSGPMRIGKRYATDVMDIHTLPAITQYTGNVLIIHGDRDRLVDISGSENAVGAYRAAGAEVDFKIIHGAGHIFLKPGHISKAKRFIIQFSQTICDRKLDKIMPQ